MWFPVWSPVNKDSFVISGLNHPPMGRGTGHVTCQCVYFLLLTWHTAICWSFTKNNVVLVYKNSRRWHHLLLAAPTWKKKNGFIHISLWGHIQINDDACRCLRWSSSSILSNTAWPYGLPKILSGDECTYISPSEYLSGVVLVSHYFPAPLCVALPSITFSLSLMLSFILAWSLSLKALPVCHHRDS